MSMYNRIVRSQFDRTISVQARAFDPDDVRFLLIAVDLLADDEQVRSTAIKDANAWGFYALRVDEKDYSIPPSFGTKYALMHGIWIVGGKEETLLFKLKYSKFLILNADKTTMDRCVSYARMGLIGSRNLFEDNGIDFMEELTRVAEVRRAIERYVRQCFLETR